MTFPAQRPRRLRSSENIRRMVRETVLSVDDLIYPVFVTMEVDLRDYDIHVNFPGGAPTDGPSAGVTVATAVYSAIMGLPVDNRVAMTGEVSIRGLIKPVWAGEYRLCPWAPPPGIWGRAQNQSAGRQYYARQSAPWLHPVQ
jgi:hypothetical protein